MPHREGGENTAVLALLIMLIGSVVMVAADRYQPAIPAAILMAIGMGVTNAAVFKVVPQAVPRAVGGAAGWVGGLDAFGGYAIGFIVSVFLSLLSLAMIWLLKYTQEAPGVGEG